MIFSRFNISFLFVTIFLTSCSSMNVTEESVYAGDVKTVQASSIDKQDISYDSQAVFANAKTAILILIKQIFLQNLCKH